MTQQPGFLPLSDIERNKSGIRQFDIILVTGDAYVDHPSFGTALVGRILWDAGFTVGIIAQPDWNTSADFTELGKPRLFFGISSGNVDSMVNNFTPNLKRRSDDVYSPGGVPRRPDRATIVYTNRVHEIFPHTPIVIGGIEASLDGLPITITGRIGYGNLSLLMPRQIFSFTVWGKGRLWR